MILFKALTWFFFRTEPASKNAKPPCMANIMTAPIRIKKTLEEETILFRAVSFSIAGPDKALLTVPHFRVTAEPAGAVCEAKSSCEHGRSAKKIKSNTAKANLSLCIFLCSS